MARHTALTRDAALAGLLECAALLDAETSGLLTTESSSQRICDDVVRVLGNGKKGSRVWMDCDGNEVMRIEWNDGLITSSGDEYMEAGCDGVSSYSYYW